MVDGNNNGVEHVLIDGSDSQSDVSDKSDLVLNDALRKAIQSTATNPAQATFLESVLKQIDVARFEQDQQHMRCTGPSIPTPNISGGTLIRSGVNLVEREYMEVLVNESQGWEDVEFEVALDSGSIVSVCHPDSPLPCGLASKKGKVFEDFLF